MTMIYCVEDDKSIREIEMYTLQSTGFETKGFEDGHSFFEELKEEKPDLILLDVMLPDEDGISILTKLKKNPDTSDIPVIIASAKGEEYDKIKGLDTGADDYVVKPFSIKVLLKRMEVVLKRKSNENVFMCGQVILYSDRKQVFVGKTEISLTLKEYQLLEYFIMNQNQVLTKEMIMENIWGIDSEFIDPNTISVMISRLKKKLNDSSNVISNVFGMGYRMGD